MLFYLKQPNSAADANDAGTISQHNAKKLLLSLQKLNTDLRIENIKREIRYHDENIKENKKVTSIHWFSL